MNNLRDTENDRASGKITIPVRIGAQATKIYQTVLVLVGAALYGSIFCLLPGKGHLLLWFIPAAALFAFHLVGVWKEKRNSAVSDKQLKICVLSTLVYGITFVVTCCFVKWDFLP